MSYNTRKQLEKQGTSIETVVGVGCGVLFLIFGAHFLAKNYSPQEKYHQVPYIQSADTNVNHFYHRRTN